jgi:hypothetical protein
MTGAREARRRLRQYGRSQGNWRLKGLFLAGLETSGVRPSDVAKAWPTKKSDYRMLAEDKREHPRWGQERRLSVPEESEAHRNLSGVTNQSDWQDGPLDETAIHMDKLIKQGLAERKLAFGDSTEEFDVLWQQQLLDTVIEGSKKNQIARDAAFVQNVDRQQGTHPRGQDASFARPVSEGGAIRDDMEDYDGDVTWDTTKFGEGARATEELINQSQIDLIERQVEWLGAQCENALNRVWLTELIDNPDTNNDVDASAATNGQGVGAVNEAIANIEDSDFQPDTIVTHPRYTQTLFNDDNILFANQFGDDEGIRQRMEFPLLGLEGFRGSGGVYDPDGSETWDFTADGETGAVVYDSDLIAVYIFRDIEVKDYDDPIRDLEGVNARIEVDSSYHQPSASARIQQ